MWRQRSKALWLKEGDQNSKFFHTKAYQRRRRNSIWSLKNERGEWVHGEGRDKLILDYFEKMFSSTYQRSQMDFLGSLEGRVTPTMNEALRGAYT